MGSICVGTCRVLPRWRTTRGAFDNPATPLTLGGELSRDIAGAARLTVRYPDFTGRKPYEITDPKILERLAALVAPDTRVRYWGRPIPLEGGLYVDVYTEANGSMPDWKL